MPLKHLKFGLALAENLLGDKIKVKISLVPWA